MSTVIRWNPVREIAAMQGAIDRLFDESWRTVRPTVGTNVLPLDVYETDTAYVVYSTLPGTDSDKINISLDDDVLTISAELAKPAFDEKENTRVLLSERGYGKFNRSVRLGLPVDNDKIEAAYENGVLKLALPKAAQAQPKQIRVSAANGHIEN